MTGGDVLRFTNFAGFANMFFEARACNLRMARVIPTYPPRHWWQHSSANTAEEGMEMSKDLPPPPDHGANRRMVKKRAGKYGAKWEPVTRTGDSRMWHPQLPELGECRFSDHDRQDAPRHLTQWVKKLYEFLRGDGYSSKA